MTRGPLLIIGGGEDKGKDSEILRRFVDLCSGGPEAPRIAVVTTASNEGEAVYSAYQRAFYRLGLSAVEAMNVHHRSRASDDTLCQQMDRLTGMFFGGGDQLRITATLGGSRFHQKLLARHAEGMVVAGTSAGASMMSLTMIVEGDARESPTKNTVKMATGMGLWTGAVIDQHFSQRGRIGRLLSAVAQNPDILGVGLDENTAIEVCLEAKTLRVWGEATVTIVDGRQIIETNASESEDSQPLALTGVVLHVLPKGYGLDLKTRQPFVLPHT
jgi:cyanophycinase